MKEFTKISMHNHIGGKDADRFLNDDYDKVLVFDFNEACGSIRDAYKCGFRLLGLTNANAFSSSFYYLIRYYSKFFNIELLPGIEMNIQNYKKHDHYHHFVTIFNPNTNLIDVENLVNSTIYNNKNNYFTVDQYVTILASNKCVIIIHGLKQNNRSSLSNPETLVFAKEIDGIIPVILEDNEVYHRETLKTRLKYILNDDELEWIDDNAVVSCADRLSFSSIVSPTLMWGDSDFDSFYYASIMKESRFFREQDVLEKPQYISKIKINSKGKSQIRDCDLDLSHGVNTVIGKSGSGKTLLLDLIYYKLKNLHLSKSRIPDKAYEGMMDNVEISLIDNNGNNVDADSLNVFEGDSLYDRVIDIYSSDKANLFNNLDIVIDDEDFKNYILDYNNKLNIFLKRKKRIKQIEIGVNECIQSFNQMNNFLKVNNIRAGVLIKYLVNPDISVNLNQIEDNLENINHDLNLLTSYYEGIISLFNKYNIQSDISGQQYKVYLIAFNEIKKLFYKNKLQHNLLNKEKLIQEKCYEICLKYNNMLSKRSRSIMETKQELSITIRKIINLSFEKILIKRENIVPTLDSDLLKSYTFNVPTEFSEIAINKTIVKFENKDLVNIFNGNIGLSKDKLNKSLFDESYDFSNKQDVSNFVDIFVNNDYGQSLHIVDDYNYFYDFSLMLKDLDGEFYDISSMTAGTLSKIYINNFLEKQIKQFGKNAIILFDQPENNMEKSFLVDSLIPKILELKMNHQIFITTHEPLLVVNADSNRILYAQNEKTIGDTFNNDIEYSNMYIDKPSSKQDCINTIANLIDGGTEAVEKRNNIYKGVNNG